MGVSAAKNVSGWMKPRELEWLAKQAATRKRILEVGSYHGRSTTVLALSAHVWCIDKWDSATIGEDDHKLFLKNTKRFKDKLTVLRGDSHDMLDKLIADGLKFEMIFVDGCHEYATVYGDIKRAKRLLEDNGLLCGHDYSVRAWPGVVKAVDELVPGFKRVGKTAIWYKV